MSLRREEMVQNDNGKHLIFTIKKDGRIESLLGATVKFQMMGSSTGTTIKRECIITDANAAECTYTLTSADLAIADSYKTELQVLYANGTKLTKTNPIIIIVRPEIIPG